jgi:predicted AAA+ superfamily ATPase
MHRDIEAELIQWKGAADRMPLLVRGARQVGKTFIIEEFAKQHFNTYVFINLEQKPEFHSCFESLEPQKIISELELLSGQKIIPGETLLFLDEIQDCPKAIMAFRYFKEQLPILHVIGAGSLLEFTLNDENFKMPVGRVDFLYLQPLSFAEFLEAIGSELVREQLKKMTLKNAPSAAVHEHLLKFVREYTILGGMPAVVKKYILTKSFLESQHTQSALLNSYRRDFGKYAKKAIHRNLQLVFEKAPGLVGQWFKYKNVNSDTPPKEIKAAVTQLYHAGILHPIHATSASGIPLAITQNEKKFKLLFLDVGLVKRACRLDSEFLLKEDIFLLNGGALAEQYVGQALLAYQDKHEFPELYFWAREEKNSKAEVDYLTIIDGQIIPVEVKSGATGKLKSLKIFMEEKKSKIGIRISRTPLSLHQNILSVPFYLINELPRLVRDALRISS